MNAVSPVRDSMSMKFVFADIFRDYYLISAGWVGEDASQIAVVWMTRMQNLSMVSACRAPTWECEETHSERAPEGLWLDAQPHPLFAPDGDSFLLLATVQEGDKEHFTHIKHVTLTQQRIAVLSHGRYEVSFQDRYIMSRKAHFRRKFISEFKIELYLLFYMPCNIKNA